MAINKRFLGLGFTFAATDKGLEKKLKGVRSELEGIQKALDGVSQAAMGSKKSMSKMMVGGKSRVTAKGMAQYPRKQAERPIKPRHPKANDIGAKEKSPAQVVFGDVVDGLRKTNTQFFTDIQNALEPMPGLAKTWTESLDNLYVQIDKDGKLTEKSQSLIASQMQSIAAGSTDIGKLSKNYHKLFEVFRTAKDYIKSVTSAFDNFLVSLGVDLSGLVPPQLKAFGSLVKTALIVPLLGIGKGLLGKARQSAQKNTNKRLIDIRKNLTEMRASISGAGNKTIVTQLQRIEENTRQKDKKGIFDKITDMLSGALGGIGALFSGVGVGSLMKVLPGVVGMLGRFSVYLAAAVVIFTALKGAWDGLSPYFSEIGENLKATGKALASIGSKLLNWGGKMFSDYIASPLSDLFGKVADIMPQGIKDAFGALKEMITGTFSEVSNFFIAGAKSIFSGIANIVSPEIREMFSSIFRDLVNILKNPMNILSVIGKGYKAIGSVVGSAARDATKTIRNEVQAIDRTIPNIPTRDYSALPSRESETKALMQRMAAAQEESNQILNRISAKDTKPIVNVTPKFNIKSANGAKVEQEEIAARGHGR